ncbi:MAG: hypothetical protein HPY45_16025 [Anaerolineae bacterium]|nr:hypothetical protein [Anaerolineae bacterium]
MPDLAHVLEGNDLGFLRMVANAWGIEMSAPDVRVARSQLVAAMRDERLVMEVVQALPEEARQALQALLENNGCLSWSFFTRRFGEVRSMGAAKRDRERPDLNPVSSAEYLWYRALIGRDFLDLASEPQEYAYVPDDLLQYLTSLTNASTAPLGRPASPLETAYPKLADDGILDETCTLLAALRIGLDPAKLYPDWLKIPLPVLLALLRASGLVGEDGLPVAQKTREFLEARRAEALLILADAWMQSASFNELLLLPGLRFEGDWQNDPLRTRQALLEMINALPQQSWWSLSAFVHAVRDRHPDFQRPAGDYDSWFIFSESSGNYLRGFSSWDEVDGALIRFMITGPLHWLGLYDLASSTEGGGICAFRPSSWSAALWQGNPPDGLAAETEPLWISSQGYLRLKRLTPRSVRYQLSRFCHWEMAAADEYRYRLTPGALQRAKQQGLQLRHLITLLQRHAASPLPPLLIQALERWDRLGVQAHFQKATLLRLSSPEILTSLRKTHAARFLGEQLTPTVVIVRAGGAAHVRDALLEIGYLPGEVEMEDRTDGGF